MVKEIRIELSDEKVTAWGGIQLMKDIPNNLELKEFMSSLDLPEKGSNRGYNPIQIMECFWTSIWIGAGRGSHSDYLRYDKVVKDVKEYRMI